jgi:hypothetical protein
VVDEKQGLKLLSKLSRKELTVLKEKSSKVYILTPLPPLILQNVHKENLYRESNTRTNKMVEFLVVREQIS